MNGEQESVMELDFNSVRTVDLYPYEEVVKIMEALKLAEKKNDQLAMKWCAKKILWLYEISSTSEGCISPEQAGKLFMLAYTGEDAPPALIAPLVA